MRSVRIYVLTSYQCSHHRQGRRTSYAPSRYPVAIMKKLQSIHPIILITLLFVARSCFSDDDAQPALDSAAGPFNLSVAAFGFSPSKAEIKPIFTGQHLVINVTFPLCQKNYTTFEYSVDQTRVSGVEDVAVLAPSAEQPCYRAEVKVVGRRVGRANVFFAITYANPDQSNPCQKTLNITGAIPISVPRMPTLDMMVFKVGTIFFLALLNFGFGLLLNLDIVLSYLKRPIPPAIGFFCQYICMPLIGFAVASALLPNPYLGFGMLCSSASPGGSGSNVWCLLLGGDVDLSITMTFISTTASLVMMPLWLFTLGRFFINTDDIKIPYMDIIFSLCIFVFPCFVGILLRKFKLDLATKLGKYIKPFSMVFLVWMVTVGLYVNRYIYPIVADFPKLLIPALLQPYLGFALAYGISTLLKQPKNRRITIAIETGVQNVAIPMVMLQNSFAQPFGDIAAVMPAITVHFTPIPMALAYLYLVVKRKCLGIPAPERLDEDGKMIDEDTIEISTPTNGTLVTFPPPPFETAIAESTPLRRAAAAKKGGRFVDDGELESMITTKVDEALRKYMNTESVL